MKNRIFVWVLSYTIALLIIINMFLLCVSVDRMTTIFLFLFVSVCFFLMGFLPNFGCFVLALFLFQLIISLNYEISIQISLVIENMGEFRLDCYLCFRRIRDAAFDVTFGLTGTILTLSKRDDFFHVCVYVLCSG